ncbi:MAG TPA: alkaline phosphatase family protein [Candidatus Eisenbacteria bacterium]|nr:alkaline phosphatase family protein [Candidatus Eisenbacteria bacterium]
MLLFFIDGVGVGEDDANRNPLATGEFPSLRLTRAHSPYATVGAPALAYGLDASMGVPGLPQSATGQTTILTGVDAPAALGKHISGFPGPQLKSIIRQHSILKRIREAGRAASFLNAFGPRFFETPETMRRLSATTLATLASGAPFRTWTDLLEGRAVVHDLTHWRMREWGFDLPLRTPEEAGVIIAQETALQNFALFEYFETDRAGHDQDRSRAMRCLADIDRALQVALARLDLRSTSVIVVSDHGNVEDMGVKTHTANPAFFTLWGGWRPAWEPKRLTDIVPLIWEALGFSQGDGGAVSAGA